MGREGRKDVRALLVVITLFLAAAFLAAPAADAPSFSRAESLLVLGPILPPPEPGADRPALAPEIEPVPELDPDDGWPDLAASPVWGGRTTGWRELVAGSPEATPAPGVYWFAARLEVDRFAAVTLSVEGGADAQLFVDGRRAAADEKTALARGSAEILARVRVRGEEASGIALTASAPPDTKLRWHLDERVAPARYRLFRRLHRMPKVAVAPDGSLVARETLTHDGGEGTDTRRWLDVLSADGETAAAHLGGPGAAPLAFSPDGSRLAVKLPDDPHADLAVWHVASGRLEPLLEREPHLRGVRWSPDGRGLLVISGKGAEGVTETEETDPSRRVHPRENVPDYRTEPHLHWVDAKTGARRRLTLPGDFVLDDAAFGPEGTSVFYARTVPIDEHPWFETEIRRLQLDDGEDRRLDVFRAGWEIRPSQLAVSPDGRHLAFVGPPDEVGGGRPAHNVLHTRLYELDLETLVRRPLPVDTTHAYGYPRAAALRWLADGNGLITTRLEGAQLRLVRVTRESDDRWGVIPLALGRETIDRVALGPRARAAAVVTSSRSRPRELWIVDLASGEAQPLERPNAARQEGWLLSRPSEVRVEGPGGDPLDAWYYPPSFAVESRKIPLVVYYYGGATPTTRSFVPMHQMLAANGYGVLVVNPRGAAGYSQAFADHHAGDWGPLASADILAAIDRLLEMHPEINRAAVGIFGGSYGGFMTNYLLTRTDRFAAAVSMYGISDIATYWGRGAWGWTYGDMASAGAVPWEDHELYVERSPLRLAGRIRTPLLLLHGEEDVNVPPAESQQLYRALSLQGRPVELVTFPGERHGLSEEYEHRIAHRTMILEWFDLHLRDQPEAWEHRWSDDET
jgi:dipeptidyl aminopeptidase/acylaminoacyl peptidase